MSEELRRAYELIRNEWDWCQGFLTNTVVGDPPILQRCAAGAAIAAHVSLRDRYRLDEIARELFPLSRRASGYFGAVVWVNDTLGHEAVLAVFEKVLAEQGLLA